MKTTIPHPSASKFFPPAPEESPAVLVNVAPLVEWEAWMKQGLQMGLRQQRLHLFERDQDHRLELRQKQIFDSTAGGIRGDPSSLGETSADGMPGGLLNSDSPGRRRKDGGGGLYGIGRWMDE